MVLSGQVSLMQYGDGYILYMGSDLSTFPVPLEAEVPLTPLLVFISYDHHCSSRQLLSLLVSTIKLNCELDKIQQLLLNQLEALVKYLFYLPENSTQGFHEHNRPGRMDARGMICQFYTILRQCEGRWFRSEQRKGPWERKEG